MKAKIAIFLLATGQLLAATPAVINPSTNSPADIKAAITSADPNGGTVINLKPDSQVGGPTVWTTALTISNSESRPCILQGAGTGGTGTTIRWNGTGYAITWNVADDPTPLSGSPVLTRITGINFDFVSGTTKPWQVKFQGHNDKNSRFRWDHCRGVMGGENWIADWIGLMDHNTFIATAAPMWRPGHSLWNGGSHGNLSWQAPLNWNSDQWIYMEDNAFYADGTNGSTKLQSVMDATSAARIIIRHNKLFGGAFLTHGNDTGNSIPDASRGVTAMGLFCNEYFGVAVIGDNRSGICMAYGNRRHEKQNSAPQGAAYPNYKNYREYNFAYTYKGGADGNPANIGGQYDNNDQINTTTPKAQNATQLHAVGASSGNVVQVATGLAGSGSTSPGWTTNQWTPQGPNPNPSPTPATIQTVNYTVVNKTQERASSNGNMATNQGKYFWAGSILSHDANHITFYAGDFSPGHTSCTLGVNGNCPLRFNDGDEIEIRHINTLMDGGGMHGDSSAQPMTGNPTITPPGVGLGYPAGQSTQIILPGYSWDNYIWNDTANAIGNRINANNNGAGTPLEGINFIQLSGQSTANVGSIDTPYNPANWVKVGGGGPGSTPPPQTTDAQGNIHGFTEYTYPHPLQGGAHITSDASTTFTPGATNTFLVTTSGFSGTPTVTIGAWTPSTPANISFGTPTCAAATFCGNANTNNPGDAFSTLITATDGTNTDTKQFTVNIAAPPNTPPVWGTGSFVVSPTSGTAPLDVNLSTTNGLTDNVGVVKVEFYRDTTLINTDTTPPFAYTDPAVGQGSYNYKAIAYDGGTPQLSTTSSIIGVTLGAGGGATPTPPTNITVKP